MKHLLAFTAFFCLLTACNRLSDKGKDLAEKATKLAEEKGLPMLDSTLNKLERRRQKYFGHKPDTTANRELYTDFFEQAPTPDVKLDTSFHSYFDYIGIDFTEQLGFSCNEETARRLFKQLELKRATPTDQISYGFRDDLSWWDDNRLEKLDAWCLLREKIQSYQYAWYDETRHIFYYLNFST